MTIALPRNPFSDPASDLSSDLSTDIDRLLIEIHDLSMSDECELEDLDLWQSAP